MSPLLLEVTDGNWPRLKGGSVGADIISPMSLCVCVRSCVFSYLCLSPFVRFMWAFALPQPLSSMPESALTPRKQHGGGDSDSNSSANNNSSSGSEDEEERREGEKREKKVLYDLGDNKDKLSSERSGKAPRKWGGGTSGKLFTTNQGLAFKKDGAMVPGPSSVSPPGFPSERRLLSVPLSWCLPEDYKLLLNY